MLKALTGNEIKVILISKKPVSNYQFMSRKPFNFSRGSDLF